MEQFVVARASKPERVAKNFDVFDFAPEPEHMTAVDALHYSTRVLHDPLVFAGTQLAGQTG
jgi:2,5-diketo-D-gluconate reductase A